MLVKAITVIGIVASLIYILTLILGVKSIKKNGRYKDYLIMLSYAISVIILANFKQILIIAIFTIMYIAWKVFKKRNEESDYDYGDLIIGCVGCFCIVALLSSLLAAILMTEKEESWSDTYKLISAKDSTGFNGSVSKFIFFVQLSISDTKEYNFYYQEKDGGIKLLSVPAENTTLYYIDDDEEPYMEKITIQTYWQHSIMSDVIYRDDPDFEYYYNLYVPEGSIVNEFEFDAS